MRSSPIYSSCVRLVPRQIIITHTHTHIILYRWVYSDISVIKSLLYSGPLSEAGRGVHTLEVRARISRRVPPAIYNDNIILYNVTEKNNNCSR